jgi:hypothetical protein
MYGALRIAFKEALSFLDPLLGDHHIRNIRDYSSAAVEEKGQKS